MSSSLCNVIPEKFQNDEVKIGIIRIKARVNDCLVAAVYDIQSGMMTVDGQAVD